MTDDAKNKKNTALRVVPGVSRKNSPPESNGKKRMSGSGRRILTTPEFVQGVLQGDRSILARAVTLVESNAVAHQEQAQQVLQELMPHTGKSIRIGVTGLPGAGKSTLIEALGMHLVGRGHQVAVLTIDPSSTITKGSILGDKTRMERLSREPLAFIRPSPSGGTLGGVARKTRESMFVFEAAGFDVILVETMGVGQSEIRVRSMVDFVLLILISGAGDTLQGIKKGAVELADALVVNKADGSNLAAAEATCGEFAQALHYLRPATEGWITRAVMASALKETGISDIWGMIKEFRDTTRMTGVFKSRRRQQALDWLHHLIEEGLKTRFYRDPKIVSLLQQTEDSVVRGKTSATQAALDLLDVFDSSENDPQA